MLFISHQHDHHQLQQHKPIRQWLLRQPFKNDTAVSAALEDVADNIGITDQIDVIVGRERYVVDAAVKS